MLRWIPYASLFQAERDQPQCGHIEPRGLDHTGEIRIAGIIPLLAWPNDGDLAGNHGPQAAGAERDALVATQQPATSGLLLYRQHDQLDGTAQVEGGRW